MKSPTTPPANRPLFQAPTPRMDVLTWLAMLFLDTRKPSWVPPLVGGRERFDRVTWNAAVANVLHVVSDPKSEDVVRVMLDTYPVTSLAWVSDEWTLTLSILTSSLKAIDGDPEYIEYLFVCASEGRTMVDVRPDDPTRSSRLQDSPCSLPGSDAETFIGRLYNHAMHQSGPADA